VEDGDCCKLLQSMDPGVSVPGILERHIFRLWRLNGGEIFVLWIYTQTGLGRRWRKEWVMVT
jgi:hypothetical protein